MTTGIETDTFVEITSGLAAGENVVIQGQSLLYTGAWVNVSQQGSPSAPATGVAR